MQSLLLPRSRETLERASEDSRCPSLTLSRSEPIVALDPRSHIAPRASKSGGGPKGPMGDMHTQTAMNSHAQRIRQRPAVDDAGSSKGIP